MRRAGGWFLGALAVVAMAAGGWIAFRPILNRETIRIAYLSSPDARVPTRDAFVSGVRFALDEAGWRAGPYHIKFDVDPTPGNPPYDILLTVDHQRLLQAEFPDDVWTVSDERPYSSVTISPLLYLDALGRVAAGWTKDLGVRNAVLVYDQMDTFSGSITLTFRSELDSVHHPYGQIVDIGIGRDKVVETILQTKPDLVFFAGESAPFNTANDLFETLRSRGYAGRLAMADADPEVSFLAVSKRVVEGTYLFSTIGSPSKEFAASYPAATGRHPGPHAWPAYQVTRRLLNVIGESPSSRLIDLRHRASFLQDDRTACSLYVLRNGKFEFVEDRRP